MRRETDTRNAHTQRKGHVKTQGEGSHLQVKERELSGHTNPDRTLILAFQPPELGGYTSVVYPGLGSFVMAA